MSFFEKLTGKKKKQTQKGKTQKVNEAIHALRDQITILTKRKECNEKKIATLNSGARECMKNKDKKGALTKLKLRKQMQKTVETVENQIFNLEVQIMSLEESLMNQHTLNAMKVARDALHTENFEDLMTEAEENHEAIQEALEIQSEFSTLLSDPLVDFDEDELEAELAEINDDMRDNGLIYGHNHSRKSNKSDLKIEEDAVEEEVEAKQVEMEMNMSSKSVLVAC